MYHLKGSVQEKPSRIHNLQCYFNHFGYHSWRTGFKSYHMDQTIETKYYIKIALISWIHAKSIDQLRKEKL